METEKTDDIVKKRMAYFESHGLPCIFHHLQMRNTGLQVFAAVQGGLLYGWSNHPHWAFAILGLGATLSFFLWDSRNRFIIRVLRETGERLVDRELFGVGEDGKAKDGINKLFAGTIARSGRIYAGPQFLSHTWAIRVLLILGTVIWTVLLLKG